MTEVSHEGETIAIGGEAPAERSGEFYSVGFGTVLPTVKIAGAGRRYRTRDGQVVKIVKDVRAESDPYAWYGEYDEPGAYEKYGGLWYCADGYLFADTRYRPHPLDLVEEVL